jgi:peroxiredoxin
MQKKILLTVFLVLIAAGCLKQSEKGAGAEIQLSFFSAYTDSLGQKWMGIDLTKDSRKIKPVEKIRAYPSEYTLKKVYFLTFQEDQYAYSIASRSKEDHDRVLSMYPDGWYTDAKTHYTPDYVDCIGIVCIVQNSKGEEKVVFDSNNDEDLSNDPIFSFSGNTILQKEKGQRIETAVTIIETEYYDGTAVGIMRLPVALRRVDGKPVRYEYSIRQFQLARLMLNDKVYLMGLLNNSQIEYKPADRLWIDLNGNGQFDGDDHFKSVNIPFFIGTRLFEARELGRFGNYMVIHDMTPVLTKGSAAPDFNAVTVDSVPFQLSKLRGKYVLLEFWATWCEPCRDEIITMKEAYDTFTSKGLVIVSVGIDTAEAVRHAIREYGMDWTHIAVPKKHPLLEQYRIRDIPYPFLIDPEGVIRACYVDLLGPGLMQTLQKTIQ